MVIRGSSANMSKANMDAYLFMEPHDWSPLVGLTWDWELTSVVPDPRSPPCGIDLGLGTYFRSSRPKVTPHKKFS